MKASIVIPTYNRAGLLPETIPALVSQRTDSFDYEVIFVVNGSQDNTVEVLGAAAAKHPNLRFFVLPPTGGPSAPRNKGIREAAGEIVLILDDDVVPDETMLLEHVRFHRNHPEQQYAALGELYVPERMLQDPISLFHEFPYHEFRDSSKLSYLHFWSCNVSVKRKFMLAHGLFREDFLCYEDVISGYNLVKAGMELRFVPQARGQHLHQLRLESLPAKGRLFGNWLGPTLSVVPARVAMIRFGVLSPQIGYGLLLKRLVKRAGFHLFHNGPMLALLRFCGGNATTRSRMTDFYLYLTFRGYILKGHAEYRRAARRGMPLKLQPAGEGIGGAAPKVSE